MSENLPTITRFMVHAVHIDANRFTIEHPPTCVLADCYLHARAEAAWQSPPALLGLYAIADDLTLTPLDPSQRATYALVRVADGQTATAETADAINAMDAEDACGSWCAGGANDDDLPWFVRVPGPGVYTVVRGAAQ